jgi:hypothetical protein
MGNYYEPQHNNKTALHWGRASERLNMMFADDELKVRGKSQNLIYFIPSPCSARLLLCVGKVVEKWRKPRTMFAHLRLLRRSSWNLKPKHCSEVKDF